MTNKPLSQSELYWGLAGLVLLPLLFGPFFLIRSTEDIDVVSCETARGRRGSIEVVQTSEGESLAISPLFFGEESAEAIAERLCPSGRARVRIHGSRWPERSFLHRIVVSVESGGSPGTRAAARSALRGNR